MKSDTSAFDPVLCKFIYHNFCNPGDICLDPFAGGPERGVMASERGVKYIGIDVRHEQIVENKKYIEEHGIENIIYYEGDSNVVLESVQMADIIFTCPPYADNEIYSTTKGDISQYEYPDFFPMFCSIMGKAVARLRPGGICCVVISEIRRNGCLVGFVPDTINFMTRVLHLDYLNEIILVNSPLACLIQARKLMKKKMVARQHQNILMFKKHR